MIIYDLVCSEGHGFEGWFQDHDAFQDQLQRGMVECPVCGSREVEQSLTTGGILRNRGGSLKEEESRSGGEPGEPSLGELLHTLRVTLEKHFEDVGTDFAKTALKMHYGLEEKRNIRGTTTEEEERVLKDEGIPFIKVPFPAKEGDSEYH